MNDGNFINTMIFSFKTVFCLANRYARFLLYSFGWWYVGRDLKDVEGAKLLLLEQEHLAVFSSIFGVVFNW